MEAKLIEGDLWSLGIVEADSGKDRLELRYLGDMNSGFNFHELVWEKYVDRNWVRYKTLSANEFSTENSNKAWIAGIHSLEPEHGRAIILVAEGGGRVNYYWSSYDLFGDSEMKLLQTCKDPFEKYAG
jgi:hypothetical protein